MTTILLSIGLFKQFPPAEALAGIAEFIQRYSYMLTYTELDDYFAANTRNILTKRRLRLNDRVAAKLPQPSRYGHFADPANYLATLNVLHRSTQEAHRGRCFLYTKVLPQIKHKQNFLDVGPGNGKICKFIGRYFQSITLVDSHPETLSLIKRSMFHPSKTLYKLIGKVEDVELPECEYNLIVLSHVLYYIDPRKWLGLIEQLYNKLADKGIMVIIMNSGLDKAAMIKHFGGEPINLIPLENCCETSDVNCEIYTSQESFHAIKLETMLQICNLHLNDGGADASEEELTGYLQQFYDAENKLYKLSSQLKFFVLHK